MAFFSFWKKSGQNSRDDRKRSRALGSRPGAVYRLRRLRIGSCRRRVPILPPAVVTNPNYLAPLAGSSPTLVQDPVNPLHLLEVNTTGALVQAVYSNDGGTTWHNLLNPITNPVTPPNRPNLPDPNLNASPTVGNPVRYAVVGAPSAAIDLTEMAYITYVEQDATGNSGALVLQRYDFTTGIPTPVTGGTNQVLDQWFGADPVLNPVIAVDNNVGSFTDSTVATDNVQTDTMVSKAVYIAWSTANTAPTKAPVPANFNANVIKAIASADGGVTFTTPQFVSDGGNVAPPRTPISRRRRSSSRRAPPTDAWWEVNWSSSSTTSETTRSISTPASRTPATSPRRRQGPWSPPARPDRSPTPSPGIPTWRRRRRSPRPSPSPTRISFSPISTST